MKVRGTMMPDVTFARLKYTDNYTFNTVSDILTEQVFRGNSLHDPDLTGTGHQAMGHDFWKAFYSKYNVSACKIEIRYNSSTQTSNSLLNFGVVPTLSSTALSTSDVDVYNEHPKSKYRITAGSNSSAGKGYIKHYQTTARMFGRTHTTNDDIFETAFDSNPGSAWYWHVYAGTMDETSDIDITFNVKLTYYVKMYQQVSPTTVH